MLGCGRALHQSKGAVDNSRHTHAPMNEQPRAATSTTTFFWKFEAPLDAGAAATVNRPILRGTHGLMGAWARLRWSMCVRAAHFPSRTVLVGRTRRQRLPVATCAYLWLPVATCGYLYLWLPVATCGALVRLKKAKRGIVGSQRLCDSGLHQHCTPADMWPMHTQLLRTPGMFLKSLWL